MTDTDQAYTALREHLDKQAVGFPATRKGAELKILKHIFTPEEARIACCLTFRPEPLETVFQRAAGLVESEAALAKILERIQRKGGIETRVRDGRRFYCNAPLVVGMYELQIDRLTPEFVLDFKEYTSDKRFGLSFLSTRLPQMRTIPVKKSVRPESRVATYDEVTALMEAADEPFVVIECICRKKKNMENKPCRMTDRKETCLAIGDIAQMFVDNGTGRQIDRKGAIALLEENQKEGLVLQPSNTQKAEFICSCCGCCCGILDIHKHLPKPLDFFATNYHAKIDADACDGCGVCESRCQVGAVRVMEKTGIAAVDTERCLGCGVCIPTCPNEALSLEKNKTEVEPPKTRDELYEIIMAGKKERTPLKVAAKLAGDAIRTGRTDILK
ncbi:MAG: 4Fe-4S binding protein [Desulfobacterales bacterium]|jgi:ferredoxin